MPNLSDDEERVILFPEGEGEPSAPVDKFVWEKNFVNGNA